MGAFFPLQPISTLLLFSMCWFRSKSHRKKKKENVVGFLGFGMSFFSVEEMLMKARALSSDAPNLHLCSGGSGKKKLILAMCIQVCGESPKHQIYLKNK